MQKYYKISCNRKQFVQTQLLFIASKACEYIQYPDKSQPASYKCVFYCLSGVQASTLHSEKNDLVVAVVVVVLFKGYKWIVSLFIGLKWLITFQFIWLGKRAMSLVSISYELQSHSVHKYTTTNNTWTDEQMNVIHLTNWLASSHSSVFGLCDSLNNECNAIAPSRINAKKKQQ